MVFIETEVNSGESVVVKVLLKIDDYNELTIEKTLYENNIFKIFNYDSLTKTTSHLADFIKGQYIIYNEILFDQYYIKPLKNDKKMVKELHAFTKADYNMDGFKEFSVKFNCFRRRVNNKITKLIKKIKRVIWG
jgi:hypothetical protein